MSFGFSVGDFLAAGQLVADLISSLRDVGGSKSEYQALVIELDCLQKTFIRLDSIPVNQSSPALEAVKYTALSCRRPLEDFLGKIRKYEQSLGTGAKEGPIRTTVDKVRFAFGQKDEVQKFQSYLHAHVQTINLLLSEHGVARANSLSDQVDRHTNGILDRIDTGHNQLTNIQGDISLQAGSVMRSESILKKLFAVVNGDVASPLASLESMVTKACVAVQQIYTTVLEIRTNMVSTDARWSFFQSPCLFEDALGRKIPVPSEYDLDLLHAIIRQRFRNGPGAPEVRAGDYEVFYTNNSRKILRHGAAMIPSSSLRMAIKLPQALKFALGDQACPMPRCMSQMTTTASWGGRVCCECGVWFDPTKSQKLRSSLQLEPIAKTLGAAFSENLSGTYDITPMSKVAYDELQSALPILLVERRIQVAADTAEWDTFRYMRYSPERVIIHSSVSIQQIWQSIMFHDYVPAKPSAAYFDPETDDPEFGTALAFVEQTKEAFMASPVTYQQFLFCLQSYQLGKVSVTTAANFMLLCLLKDHPLLLAGYARFLPQGLIEDMGTIQDERDLEHMGREDEETSDSISDRFFNFSFMREFVPGVLT
ncbi:hypothetical protein F4808DRAFT_445793 [Astrocystis sublimbata]|nr:hypothetical protein F4808DRAFT_445793 [Astrocystis sublimbata]